MFTQLALPVYLTLYPSYAFIHLIFTSLNNINQAAIVWQGCCLILGIEVNNINMAPLVQPLVQPQVQHGRQEVNKSRHLPLTLQYTGRQPDCHLLPLHSWFGFSCLFFPIFPRPSFLTFSPHSTQNLPLWFIGNFGDSGMCPASSSLFSYPRASFWALIYFSGVVDSSVDCGPPGGSNPLCFILRHLLGPNTVPATYISVKRMAICMYTFFVVGGSLFRSVLANFFYKEPNSKYFRLRSLDDLCHSYATLPLQCSSSY